MPCRVGITTDPVTRRATWERNVSGLKNWRILAKYRSRKKAQEHETRYANTYGCQASPGGAGVGGTWHVYRFDYTRTK